MAELQSEGKVRYIGASNFTVAQMERCRAIAPITSLQPPYSMLNRAVEAEILPFCQEHHIGVINYAPMHSGLLTGAMTKERVAAFPPDDFRRNAKNYQEPLLSRNLVIADFLKTDRCPPQRLRRRRRHRLDARQSRHHRRYRRRPQSCPGRRRLSRHALPPSPGRDAGDPGLPRS